MDAAREPDRAGQAAPDRRMQRPVVVRPDRRGRLPAADSARRASRLAATRRLWDLARAGLARHERTLVRQRHGAHSQLLSSDALRAVKRSSSPAETMTWPKPAACRKTNRRAGSIGL